MIFGRSERGNFRHGRLFSDEEEAKNWITEKVKQVLKLLGISTEGKVMKTDIYIPSGTVVVLGKNKALRSRNIIVTEAVPNLDGFFFQHNGSIGYVKSVDVEELASLGDEATKAEWWHWIVKEIESAGSLMGDGLRSLVMAYNRLSKASQQNRPHANASLKAYKKIKLAMNLMDKAMDFSLDAVAIMQKTYSPGFRR